MVSDFSFYFMNKKKNKTEKDRAKKEKENPGSHSYILSMLILTRSSHVFLYLCYQEF